MLHRRTPSPLTAAVLCSALMLAACTADETPAADLAEAGAVEPAAPTATPSPTAPQASTGQPADLAPCPGVNPDIRRPAGSNCLGILPSACAADRLGDFVGRSDSAAIRRELTAAAGHNNIRWIRPGEPVIENLDPARLNVSLSTGGRITKVDCY